MRVRLGLGKQTNMWRDRVLGRLYRHDWQIAALLAVAIIATAALVLWPRPGPVVTAPTPANFSRTSARCSTFCMAALSVATIRI